MASNAAPATPDNVRVRTFFVYPIPAVTLAPAGVGTATVRIESATNFYWVKSAFWADVDGAEGDQEDATRVIPSWDVQIQTSGADRNLFNGPVPVANVFGTGQIPFVLPMPQLLLANSELKVDYTSRENARTLQVRAALIGWKDYGELRA